MLQPIQKDNELICPCGCGCVMQAINEYPEVEKSLIPPSIDIFFLGSAMEKNVKYSFRRTPQQILEERVLKELSSITKEYALPERLAYEAFKELKKKRRGFNSQKGKPIKQLLEILSKDENYIHFPKMRAIKARYESIIGH